MTGLYENSTKSVKKYPIVLIYVPHIIYTNLVLKVGGV